MSLSDDGVAQPQSRRRGFVVMLVVALVVLVALAVTLGVVLGTAPNPSAPAPAPAAASRIVGGRTCVLVIVFSLSLAAL